MRIPSLFLPQLRLRPINERPEGEIMSALVFLADETPGEDNIGVHLDSELYVWIAELNTWFSERLGKSLPRNARWYLPEAELTAVPTVCAARDAAVHAIWEGRL